MRFSFPRKRILLAFHRWLGALSALFLVILSLTGLALNHTERLGLDRVQLDSEWLLHRYNMAAGRDITSYRIDEVTTVSRLGDVLYINGKPVGQGGEPVGTFRGEDLLVVGTGDALFLLTPEGELVEQMRVTALPFDVIQFIGRDAGDQPLVIADGQPWRPVPGWFDFLPYDGAFTVIPLEPIALKDASRRELLRQHRGAGVTLYRVLLDLHSGRLFGWGGRTVMDLTAVAILLLVSSGLVGWLRRGTWGINKAKR